MGGGDRGEALVGDAEACSECRGYGVEQGEFEGDGLGVETIQTGQIGEDKASLDRLDEGTDSGNGVDELLGCPRYARWVLLKDGKAGAEADGFAEKHAGANSTLGRLGSEFENSKPTLVGKRNRVAGQVRAAHQFRGESEGGDE